MSGEWENKQMPKNVPPELEEKFKSCKEKVMAQGNDEEAAYGICYMSVVEGKSLSVAMKKWAEMKVGARNSLADKKRLQAAHDALVEAGAECGTYENKSIELPEEMYINFGGAVKSLNGIDEKDFAIVYGGEDLSADYFDANTEYGFAGAKTKRVPILFHHAMPLEYEDSTKARRKYHETKPIGEAELEVTDEGVLIREAILYNRKKYEEHLKDLGWSTGAAAHAVFREDRAGKSYVKQWILSELSVTPTSAEPRLRNVVALKSLVTPSEAQGAGAQPNSGDNVKQDNNPMEGNTMTEEVKTQDPTPAVDVEAIAKAAAEKAVKAFADALPEVKAGFSVQVTKDEADNPFNTMAEQMQAVKAFGVSSGRVADPRLKRLAEVKAPLGMNEAIPSQGGFLLEPSISAEFMKPIHEEGVFSRFARNMPVDKSSGWMNGADETSRAAGSRWGGVLGYWRPEAGSITATKPKFRRINWELKSLEVLMYITDEQLEDASMTAEIARMAAAEELNFLVNDSIYNGDGVGKPLGILNAPALISQGRYTASSILNVDLLNMWQRLHPAHRANAAWFVNSEAEPQLDQLYLTSSLEARYVTYGADSVMRIKGKPVYVTEFNAALGTTGDLALCDMSDYLLFQRGIKSSVNPWLQWLTGEQAFKWTLRVDGLPATHSALTPYKGTNTQSPYVVLASTTA